uniref:Acylphosphatase n=1 Tax=uncultured Chloroflexota bacterium TaxID=166587 RepID=H5SN34_9CHLR|nr:acylphosphatase [uncultured Chloroflexota bacterium]
MKQVRVRIIIEGWLQGMNFRYQTQQQARKLGLVGFVRTLSDGRIEIEAQGDRKQVEQLLEWCQQEPHSTHIRNILYRFDDPIERYSAFNVR